MPAALAIAILKYRLYDIDVIINRAIVYGLARDGLHGVYVLVVVGIGSLVGYGTGSPAAHDATASPSRCSSSRFAAPGATAWRTVSSTASERRPYQVLSDFAERMGGTYGVDDVLRRMASILAQGTGATRVEVWLRVGRELRPAAAWPADAS